jgi:hypothetical protein
MRYQFDHGEVPPSKPGKRPADTADLTATKPTLLEERLAACRELERAIAALKETRDEANGVTDRGLPGGERL